MGSSPHARGTLAGDGGGRRLGGIIPACAGNTSFSAARRPSLRDHPRMRGEHDNAIWFQGFPKGSSPHARGTRRQGGGHGHPRGIIPACAGNTAEPSDSGRLFWDHPRMRGEHQIGIRIFNNYQGSSPHARGTLLRNSFPLLRPGIIPACAGNTRRHTHADRTARDHPRMRGEHLDQRLHERRRTGSSPHARGTRLRATSRRSESGIIPACAGNTDVNSLYPWAMRDHPRMRGEHCCFSPGISGVPGSSPHARGTQIYGVRCAPMLGIIPACAGNTHARTCARLRAKDHPRMRGEHSGNAYGEIVHLGSSPHARGTPNKEGTNGRRPGIIPACAGNTQVLSEYETSSGDHPRMRGEHDDRVVLRRVDQGSSPHARGTLGDLRAREAGQGIIPACAGNTPPISKTCWCNGDHPRMRGEHFKALSTAVAKLGSSPHARGTRRR